MIGGFLLGLIIGAVVTALVMRQKKPAPTAIAPEPRKENLYGHPWPPVSSLRKKLPTPLAGHAWETVVTADRDGRNILTLTLLNLATESKVATRRVDLTHRKYGKTYAQEYRDYPILKKDTFNNDLIGPVVDWAQAAVNKFSNAGQVVDYQLGDM
ncbi:hypothetical protein [Mycolicibacterium septicum]|uniref:hypothetical protein n=1 Tax=Mycolicibacterium septicum TaxID=98668 RepID=UPI001AF99ED4|nr:hypothetical protein [Mycolicibacterium septicum]QRY51804.1 hypothetical protein JVX95_31270 [Mycolicibacterium septicum]